jgi:glycine oxidase
LRFPRDFQIDNRRLVSALVRANEELGVRVMPGLSVHALRIEDGKVLGVETSNGMLSAPAIVVAAGAWSTLINSTVTPPFQIEPVRGQMLCFEARPQIARHVIYSSLGYLVARRDGRVLAGSTEELVGFDKRVTIEGRDAIRSMAVEIAPGIAALPMIDSWAGFRPRAKDGLPVLGPSAEVAGLFYATGHYRNGILLAPITGKVIAEMIVDRSMPANLAVFSPNRFVSI